jgi:DNA helicase-2/ATP-dependent DNA helicase PcrA
MKAPPVKIPEKYKRELNDEQLKAVMHSSGPALVIAGAGSGKTRVLTYRVAWLVENGADPHGIMLMTFTKKAAEEMTSRVAKLVPVSKDTFMAGTFHHVAGLFLRRYAKYVNYEPNFSILDRDDEEHLFKIVVGAHLRKVQDEVKRRFPTANNLTEIYSKCVNLQRSVPDIVAMMFPQYEDLTSTIESVIKQYDKEKRKQNVMDFDDLLVYFLALIRTEHVGDEIRGLVKHLLVDEYQDVNQIQADIVIELARDAKSTMVVGDDAQAIFAFRGSEIKHILDFPKRFDVPVATYYLLHNYRSTPEILAFTNSSIKHNKKQYPKKLTTPNEQGEKPFIVQCETRDEEANFICQYILEARDQGIHLHEQAVLFRASFQSQLLEKTLLQYDIPYEIRSGTRFYEMAHIKDLLCFAFIIENPSYAIAWERIFMLLPGMGTVSVEKILSFIMSKSNPLDTFVSIDVREVMVGNNMGKKTLDHLAIMQALFRDIVIDSTGKLLPEDKLPPPSKLLEQFLAFYEPYLKEKYKNHSDRFDDLKEFVGLVKRYPSIASFLAEIAISETFAGQSGLSTPEIEERPLVLSTVHQAKGLEWTNVHILGVAEDMFPNSRSKANTDEYEEERRLFYVACTRAKKKLVISYPVLNDLFQKPGKNVICHRSSFIDEVEPDGVFDIIQLDQVVEKDGK